MSEFECITCESCKIKGVKGYEFFVCNHAQLATVEIDRKVIYPYQQVRPKWCPRAVNLPQDDVPGDSSQGFQQ